MTSWNQTGVDYIRSGAARGGCDVFAVAGHHKQGTALLQQVKTLQRLGWRTTAESAVDTGTARVRGWLSTRAHLHSRGLGRPRKEALQQPEYVGVSTQWAARILRIRGHELILVVVYLAVGLG